jgi:ubiquinone/menaquinone biosynthesis C-methylase UbiE
VPEARFVHCDFTQIELEPASFDAVVSLYVFNRVPREELARAQRRARGH